MLHIIISKNLISLFFIKRVRIIFMKRIFKNNAYSRTNSPDVDDDVRKFIQILLLERRTHECVYNII